MTKLNPNHIVLLTTGGTIEKTYCESEGSLLNRGTIIRNKLEEKLRLPHTQLEVKSIMAKDSLDMDQKDRQYICDEIRLRTTFPIVVLHGTDTMTKTASLCQEKLLDLTNPVVFTGAMKPLGFEDSDALQNVTEALALVNHLNPGVYISFHSQVFPLPNVEKDRKLMTFVKSG